MNEIDLGEYMEIELPEWNPAVVEAVVKESLEMLDIDDLDGYGPGEFEPDDSILREQLWIYVRADGGLNDEEHELEIEMACEKIEPLYWKACKAEFRHRLGAFIKQKKVLERELKKKLKAMLKAA